MFWFSKIGRMVLRAIAQKIRTAEQNYKQYCKQQDQELKASVERLRVATEECKSAKAELLVAEIIGK